MDSFYSDLSEYFVTKRKKMDVPEWWTALLSGEYDLANQLINRGANINEARETEFNSVTTLLHYAVVKSNIQCIRVLKNLGANFNARDSKNCTPLHWAVAMIDEDRPDIVELLIDGGAVVDARDNQQMTPLHHATLDNYIESAQKLIARGASVDAIAAPEVRWSVLHVAITNLDMVKMLISHRVNIDAKDSEGRTPLFRNILINNCPKLRTEMSQLLLDNGADVNAKTIQELTPLMLASYVNCPATVHLLLKRGARINETIERGTALHIACWKGLADVAALLLEYGADLNACNQEGKTPIELLSNGRSSDVIARILICEAVKREALGQSVCERYKQTVQSCEKYSKFEQKCSEEIKRMQCEKIDIEDSDISLFYIFSMDEEKVAALARNHKIVAAVETGSCLASFNMYRVDLITKFEGAKKRANFLMSVEDLLGNILPAPLVQKIAGYIKKGDINENEL